MSFNGLQITKAKWNSGLTDSNSLAQALLTRPEISNTLAYAFGEKYMLQYLTQGMGRVANKYTTIGNSTYQWPLMGMLTKAIPITVDFSLTNAGLNFSTFKVGVAERYFGVGDVVTFNSRGNFARVQDEPYQDGNSWIYTLQLVTSDPTESVPAADLAVGQELSTEFTLFEEYSEGGHSVETYPFWFENQLSISRMEYSMTGSAQSDVMILSTNSREGKGSKLWMYEKEYQHMMRWMQQTERMRWYGKYNKTATGEVFLPGKNGRPVLSGSGVLEQIAYSNRRTYTTLTEKVIREFLVDLMLMSKDAENKKFIAFTGTGGMEAFHQAMRDSIHAYPVVDTHFITGSGQNLTLGGQFVTYKGLNGTELTLVHNPIFDDPVHNRALHPETGRPLESYRFVMLDFGMYGGESNISMITKGTDGINRSMVMWYTAGSTTPEGGDSGIKKVMRSNSLDGFSCHYLSETGIKIINPLSCGELVCVAS